MKLSGSPEVTEPLGGSNQNTYNQQDGPVV